MKQLNTGRRHRLDKLFTLQYTIHMNAKMNETVE